MPFIHVRSERSSERMGDIEDVERLTDHGRDSWDYSPFRSASSRSENGASAARRRSKTMSFGRF